MGRILVAGIGNVFFGDDGFGVEVVRRLAARGPAEGVEVMDAGIRGLELAHALLDGYDAAILVDALPRGGAAGTLYVLEPDVPSPGPLSDSHGVDPLAVLRMTRMLGDHLPVLRILGCEPAAAPADEMVVGLSAPVAGAIDDALEMIDALIGELRSETVSRA